MYVTSFTQETLTNTLISRLKDFSQRERIVLTFPFGHDINRIEIYCSETAPSGNSIGLGGDTFRGIVSLQVFTDYTNKPQQKSSYSYENELLRFIPKLCENIFSKLTVATN